MCGIAGVIKLNDAAVIDRDLVVDMISMMRYRGPDESGIYIDPVAALGHVRLSIIGIDDGIQPICNEDGTLWIVYNGETFNYVELKEELLAKGHRFATHTDTEILLHLYEEHGPTFLDRLNGQFALAIWDARQHHLFLARDRVGIRPLYYCNTGNCLIFTSEIKAILQSPDVPKQMDPHGLAQAFTYWSTISPATVFQGIQEVPPGHYLMVHSGAITLHRYWHLPYYPPEMRWQGSLDDAADALRELLTDAVRIRLRSDVPVGAYLSGGLDSSIITSLIAHNFNNRLRTFSINFEEDAYDEISYQSELITQLKTDHSRITASNRLIRENFPDVIWHCETPLLRTGPVPMFLLSGHVRSSGFKVVLSGEGADEVFGGYNIFKEAKIRHYWGQCPSSSRRPLLVERLYPYIFKDQARGRMFLRQFFSVRPEELDDPYFSHTVRWKHSRGNLTFFSSRLHSCLADRPAEDDLLAALPPGFTDWDLLSRAQCLEATVFMANYLLSSQGDRVGMAHSIEMRHPFLDWRVIDFAARLPAKWKLRGLTEKYLLKKTFGNDLPTGITQRPKQPYRAPVNQVFFTEGAGNDYVHELLSEEAIKNAGYFDPTKVGHLLRRLGSPGQATTNEFANMAFTGILSTQLLHHHFMSGNNGKPSQRLVPDKHIIRE